MNPIVVAIIVVAVILAFPIIVSSFLRTVDAGTIRLVSFFGGSIRIYKDPARPLRFPW